MNDYLFSVVGMDDAAYAEVVQFALPVYDAPLIHPVRQAFPSYLCITRFDRIVAACGFRGAERGLFLEQFIEVAADLYIEQHEHVRAPRSAIVELGALRVSSPALNPRFAGHMKRALLAEGFTHALVLSPSPARSVDEWVKARTAIALDTEAAGSTDDPLQGPGLAVSIILLNGES